MVAGVGWYWEWEIGNREELGEEWMGLEVIETERKKDLLGLRLREIIIDYRIEKEEMEWFSVFPGF